MVLHVQNQTAQFLTSQILQWEVFVTLAWYAFTSSGIETLQAFGIGEVIKLLLN